MGLKAGALLWNRQHITLPPGITPIDTGLRQVNQAFAGMSPNEPSYGVAIAPPGPPDGTGPASRIQVLPQSPLAAWNAVTHGEPYLNPATNTIWVTFNNATEIDEEPVSVTLNVFFWDPHSMVGPGAAEPYTDPSPQ